MCAARVAGLEILSCYLRTAYVGLKTGARLSAVVGMTVALVRLLKRGFQLKGDARDMKEIADNFMKLLVIIMVTITLAVSTAAFSMMFG